MAFNFLLPVINVTTDPQWSQEFLDIFDLITFHTHTGNSGDAYQINAADLLLSQSFSLDGFDIINARSYIMQNLPSDPSDPADVCSIYAKSGNLFYNNQLGTHIQITNGSSINVASTVASVLSYLSVPSNFTLQVSDTYTYLAVDTTAPRLIFLPSANTVPTGRFVNIKDVTGTSETNAITIVPNGANTIDGVLANYVVRKNFGSWMLTSNGSTGWLVSNYSNKELNDGTMRANGSGLTLTATGQTISISGNIIQSVSAAAASVTAGTTALITSPTSTLNGSTAVNVTGAAANITASGTDITLTANDEIILDANNGTRVTDGYLYVNNISAQSGTVVDIVAGNSLRASGIVATSILTSQGSGYIQDGFTVFSGTSNFGGAVNLGNISTGPVSVDGTATFNELVYFTKDVYIGNSSADICSILATAGVLNDFTIGTSSSDTLTINSSIDTPLRYTTGGRPTEPGINLPNSNTSVDVDSYVNLYISSAVVSGRTYTISGSPIEGYYFYVFNNSPANHNLTGLLSTSVNSGVYTKFMYIGGTWRQTSWASL